MNVHAEIARINAMRDEALHMMSVADLKQDYLDACKMVEAFKPGEPGHEQAVETATAIFQELKQR